MSKIYAVIPVKNSSERVLNKNFREFYDNLSLLEIKISQLKKARIFDKIFISSDSKKASEIAKKYDVVHVNRDEKYCNNFTPWSEVIYNVVDSLPIMPDDYVAWVHTTSPLFNDFSTAIKKFFELNNLDSTLDGLVTVSKVNDYLLDQNGSPINYSWGVWHPYSQNLSKMFKINGALFFTKKSIMLTNRYVISLNPHLYLTTQTESIDIDEIHDFDYAQYIFNKLEKKI